ncbi:DnaJ-like protein [Reticulomyxa filosa]|uniref:DnaJ-like protein n=1 Tax=Reticulomyxa filosa TaxID=46433 RepID=X6NA99_RETFI|nr:DnaJ-like protein [Reticulomyxa filosa]|eukprot:ETO22828.1 DnaJ-like protein [Reticulomyxa filosa]
MAKLTKIQERNNVDILSPISRVLSSPDYFDILQLPPPVLDGLDRPVWNVATEEIKKQYFKISRMVHPDKNPQKHIQAADAFDKVFKAFTNLSEMSTREEIIQEYGQTLVRQLKARESEGLDILSLSKSSNSSTDRTQDKINSSTLITNGDKDKSSDRKDSNKKRDHTEMEQSDKIEETHNILKHLNKRRKMREELKQSEAQSFEKEILEEVNNRRMDAIMKNVRRKQIEQKQQTEVKCDTLQHDLNNEHDSDDNFETKLNRLKAKQNSKKRRCSRTGL